MKNSLPNNSNRMTLNNMVRMNNQITEKKMTLIRETLTRLIESMISHMNTSKSSTPRSLMNFWTSSWNSKINWRKLKRIQSRNQKNKKLTQNRKIKREQMNSITILRSIRLLQPNYLTNFRKITRLSKGRGRMQQPNSLKLRKWLIRSNFKSFRKNLSKSKMTITRRNPRRSNWRTYMTSTNRKCSNKRYNSRKTQRVWPRLRSKTTNSRMI